MPTARASGRGSSPRIVINGQTSAYSSRCRIRRKRDGTIQGKSMSNGPTVPKANKARFLPRLVTLSLASRLSCARHLGPFRQRAQEGISCLRRFHPASQGRLKRHQLAVEVLRTVLVFVDDRSIQRQTGENAAGARVGKYLGAHLPVRIGGGVSSNRPGGHTGIRSQLELGRKQIIHAFAVHDEHDQINGLAADLQSETAAFDGEK